MDHFEDIPPIREEAEGLFLIGACSFCAGVLFTLLVMAVR